MGVAQVVVSLGQVGLQRDGLLAMRQGLGGSAEIEQELAEVGLCGRKLGVDRDGAAKVVEGLILRVNRPQAPRPGWCGPSRRRVAAPGPRGTPGRPRRGGPAPARPDRGCCEPRDR